jgi:spermidine synthase
VRETLYSARSQFQQIEVYDTVLFGRMLVLDGMVQTTERDEFFYHEMLVHPAMLSHPAPKRVLVVGGGDGGALRRVLEHDVERATMVEIDAVVVDVSRQYLPGVSEGAFDDQRAEVHFEDGHAFVQSCAEQFDVVIVDAPDPIGPGKQLFSEGFYRSLANTLAPGGVVALQSESPLLMATQMASTYVHMAEALPGARVYLGAVPAYPGVIWSFTIAAKDVDLPPFDTIARRLQERSIATRYYSPAIHEASFTLPQYLESFLHESARAGKPSCQHPFFPAAQGQTVLDPTVG